MMKGTESRGWWGLLSEALKVVIAIVMTLASYYFSGLTTELKRVSTELQANTVQHVEMLGKLTAIDARVFRLEKRTDDQLRDLENARYRKER